MKRDNYYLYKNNRTGEILYLEYDKIKGYPITPKTRIEDAIDVHKIVLVNPTLQEKLVRKKVDIKLKYLFKKLEEIEEDSSDDGAIQATLMEAEKLKVNIINKYVKYLGNTYRSLTINKIQMIVNQLQIKLYNNMKQKELYRQINSMNQNNLYYLDEEEPKKGRGR